MKNYVEKKFTQNGFISVRKWKKREKRNIIYYDLQEKKPFATIFSILFQGECWSGPEAGDTYFRNGEKDYENCLKSGYKPCQPGDKNCIGTQFTNYVYKLD